MTVIAEEGRTFRAYAFCQNLDVTYEASSVDEAIVAR